MTRGPFDSASLRLASPRTSCTGVILAGGRSSRFGGAPKGLARLGGERILDRVARALGEACDSLVLVANDPDADAWLPAVPRVSDRLPGLGALAGIHAALRHARAPVLVAAWDMPFLGASLLRELRDTGASGALAVVPTGPGGLPEPLCAWYSDLLLPRVESLLAAGERRAAALSEGPGTVRLDPARVAAHGDPAWLFANVNTADDLRRAEGHLREA